MQYEVSMVAGLCHFVFSPRNSATRKNEKTKRRHAKRRKDEITPREKMKSATRKDDKLTVLNVVFSHGVFTTFRVAGFVISSFRVALFRLFVFSHGVFSSFRVASFRLFVFRVALFRDEKTKWHKPATISIRY